MTEEEACAFVENRLWPAGPVCPRCKKVGTSVKLQGRSTRLGVYKCRPCRKPFRVTVGTPMDGSHVPLTVWVQAATLMAASKRGITCDDIEALGVSRKSAWFVSRRIREGQLVDQLNLAK